MSPRWGIRRWLAWTWWALLIVLTARLTIQAGTFSWEVVSETVASPSAAPPQQPPVALPEARWTLALAAWLALGSVVFAVRNRRRLHSILLPAAAVLAALGAVLGLASYGPCGRLAEFPLAPITWVLGLFVGAIEAEPSPGAVCVAAFPTGLQLARLCALLAALLGALSAILILGRRQADGMRARRSVDVDVVVGLTAMTLPLVAALVRENAERPRVEPWLAPWWRHPGSGRKARALAGRIVAQVAHRTDTVVITPDPANPHIAEARELGAVVLYFDALHDKRLERVLTARRGLRHRRIALRRMFVASGDAHDDVLIAEAAQRALAADLLPHRRHLVPRVLVQLPDQWQCWAFRNEHLQRASDPRPRQPAQPTQPASPEAAAQPPARSEITPLLDGFTAGDYVAQQIIDALMGHQPTDEAWVKRVVIIGDSPLWPTLVNELQWWVWARYEVEAWAYMRPAYTQQPSSEPPMHAPPAPVVELVGDNAALRAASWRRHRAPWRLPRAEEGGRARLDVLAAHGMSEPPDPATVEVKAAGNGSGLEEYLYRVVSQSGAAVIALDPSPDTRSTVERLARDYPHVVVMVHDPTVIGLHSPPVPGAAYTFGETLTRVESGCPRHLPPIDSLARLARQQHRTYLGTSVEEAGDPWLTGPAAKVTGHPWTKLPDFYREENIRQQWQVMRWFADRGYAWRSVTDQTAADQPLPAEGEWRDDAVRAEYERWLRLRRDTGWRADRTRRDDQTRVHPDVAGWSDTIAPFNRLLTVQVVNRLWAIGVAPALPQPPRGGTAADQSSS